MALTRRLFLERLGGTAGAAMTYEAMAALGIMAVPTRSVASAPSLPFRGGRHDAARSSMRW